MSYLSPTALKNLKKYAYKGVDECVYPSSHTLHILTVRQVSCVPLCSWPLLELVHNSLATDSRAKHSTLSDRCFSNGKIDAQPR